MVGHGNLNSMNRQPPRDLEATMTYDPEAGIADLEGHLDRLKDEAQSLGCTFDRHAARNELQAATFGRKEPAIARLLVSSRGAVVVEVRSA